ncbi:MAG: acetyl-CoA carboxylase biotin carboxyl carrier protein subunit [Mucilaginibacter sp.]
MFDITKAVRSLPDRTSPNAPNTLLIIIDDNLLVLEAMKMENIIKSPADVVVKAVKIKPGDKVEKNQVLLQFS